MFHYYMFNKPFGCVTARRDTLYPTVMDYFSELHNDRLNPVGRLDRETTGLLIITDDGNWNQQLTHPAYHKKKTYLFTVLGDLTEDRRQFLENGILLKGSPVPTSPARSLFSKKILLLIFLIRCIQKCRMQSVLICLPIRLPMEKSPSVKDVNVRSAV